MKYLGFLFFFSKKWTLPIALVVAFSRPVGGTTIHDLLEAVARQPAFEINSLVVEERYLQVDAAGSAMFPKLGILGRWEYTNSPTNLRPMPPTEINLQQGDSIPFSRGILRYALTLDAPVYVRELAILRKQAVILKEKSEMDRHIDRIGREAAVVSLNSSLDYLQKMSAAVLARKASLEKSREDMAVRVETGRTAESELLKILTLIQDLELQANELAVKQMDVQRELKVLTGMDMINSLPMELVSYPETGRMPVLDSHGMLVDAAAMDVQRQRARKLPTLSVTGFVSGNDGEAYNTDSHIYREYSGAALVAKFPLFDQTLNSGESLARVQLQKTQTRFHEVELELAALAETLHQKLPVVERSMDLARASVENSDSLLEIARVAMRSGRMILEEYLRYESNVLAARASLNQAIQQRWQILAQQAALYGRDLKGIVR